MIRALGSQRRRNFRRGTTIASRAPDHAILPVGLTQKKPATYADLEALPPELVGEIIDGELIASPRPASLPALAASTVKIDRSQKMRHFAAANVRHVWLIDPLATTLEIYRLDSEGWRLVQTHAGDVMIRPEPFDAVELALAVFGAVEATSSDARRTRRRLSGPLRM